MLEGLAPETGRELDVARRLAFVIGGAERELALADGANRSLDARLDRIMAAALAGGLDPWIYRVCWLLRGAQRTKGEADVE
jgi:hypothetical protein